MCVVGEALGCFFATANPKLSHGLDACALTLKLHSANKTSNNSS